MNIWLSNDGGHKDYPKALAVVPNADIKTLTSGSVNIFKSDRLLSDLTRGIVRFANAEDYLLPSGNAVITALAIQIWLSMYGKVKLLLWHANKREYIPVELERSHIADLVDREMLKSA